MRLLRRARHREAHTPVAKSMATKTTAQITRPWIGAMMAARPLPAANRYLGVVSIVFDVRCLIFIEF